ncbi:MAG: cytochrome C oxidase subunit II [Chloroflexota bacterium]|nr:cytochrome C oxidase subunit II [Chloroflexota bacterium]
MVDSSTVLWGQAIVYTLYAIAVLLVMAVFAIMVTRPGQAKVPKILFTVWAIILVVTGVSIHIVTSNTIPWVHMDLDRGSYTPDKTFEIRVADHEFQLPAEKLSIDCGDLVLFDVTSDDLTYGFGLIRQDNSLVMQMQVVPGSRNDILWEFDENAVYDIRSTEYSGPEGHQMIVPGAVEVTGCVAAT